MEHLKQEIIEIYILNSSLLDDKLESINTHLSKCNICKEKLAELQRFYNTVEKIVLRNKPGDKIKIALERQQLPEIHSIDDIFKSSSKTHSFKTRLFKFIKNVHANTSDFVKSVYSSVLFLSNSKKWIFASSLAMLLIFIVYLAMKIFSPTNEIIITEQLKDTISNKSEQKFSENSLELNSQSDVNETKFKDNELKVKKVKKDSGDKSKTLIAYIPIHVSLIRSNGDDINYDIFTVYNKHYNQIGVVVFDKGIIDTTKTEKDIIRNIALKKQKHYILFPKTVLNNDPDGKNYLGSKEININPKEGVEIKISDKAPQYNLEDEFVKYKFDINFNIKNIDFNSKFLRKYETLIKEKKIDSIPEETYKKILKEEIKDLK